jgi:hypothetical protein
MYAEMSQRPPPPRPFLNLLRSAVHLPCVASCERFSDCPPLLSALNTRHRDLSSRARLLAGERELRNRPATGNKALQDRDSTFRQSRRRGGGPGRAPGLVGSPDVAAALRRLVATAPVRNGITAGVVDAEPRSAVPRLGYPPHNPWRTGEVLAVSGDRQSRSPLRAGHARLSWQG